MGQFSGTSPSAQTSIMGNMQGASAGPGKSIAPSVQAQPWQTGPMNAVLGQLLQGGGGQPPGGFPQPVGLPQRQYLPGFGSGTPLGQVQGPPPMTPPTTPGTGPGPGVVPGQGAWTTGLPPGMSPGQLSPLELMMYKRGFWDDRRYNPPQAYWEDPTGYQGRSAWSNMADWGTYA
jgi:hypothetical protein